MTVKEIIKKEIDRLPENLLSEVLTLFNFESKREKAFSQKASQDLSASAFRNLGQRRGCNI